MCCQMRVSLASSKYDCPERVLRTSISIKKKIDKISLHLSNYFFKKYFMKAIENFFPVFT